MSVDEAGQSALYIFKVHADVVDEVHEEVIDVGRPLGG
jgi:hypothetical protein